MIFPAASRERLQSIYPEQPGIIRHDLADHRLFTLDALAGLAGRIAPRDLEYYRGSVPIGLDPELSPSNGLSPEETIRSIEQCGSWMVLKYIEQDPDYRDLLHALLEEIEAVVKSVTGKMLQREGFIFVSSPHSVTPFHFDPEHNILMQLRGHKTMTVFPADDEEIASGEAHELFENGGHRNLRWSDEFAARGQPLDLTPGEAIYVPVKAPHWVRNGSEVSISLSITWRSEWSSREADARAMNRILRRAGIRPASPHRFPARNLAKSAAYRGIRKAKDVLGAGRE